MNTPRADVVLIIAVLATGFGAATFADVRLWPATVAVAAALFAASRLGAASSRKTIPYLDAFPSDVRELVTATLAHIPDGAAANLLLPVVQQASAVFAARDPNEQARDAGVRVSVAELVRSSCAVASDMARLDVALSSRPVESPHDGALVSAAAARALYANRLTDAASTLAALLASGLGHGTPESERIAELIAEIGDDASVRNAAWAEVESLLQRENA